MLRCCAGVPQEQYVAMLKLQAEQGDQLMASMAQQLTELQAACEREITAVESAHAQV